MKGREVNNPICILYARGGGGVYSRFQVTRMIEGRNLVKFGKYFFEGGLIQVGTFGYSEQSEDS